MPHKNCFPDRFILQTTHTYLTVASAACHHISLSHQQNCSCLADETFIFKGWCWDVVLESFFSHFFLPNDGMRWKNKVWGRHGRLKMSLKIHLRIDETEICRCRVFKFEEKNLGGDVKMSWGLHFIISVVSNGWNILGRTGRTGNVPRRECYCNQLLNWIKSGNPSNQRLIE